MICAIIVVAAPWHACIATFVCHHRYVFVYMFCTHLQIEVFMFVRQNPFLAVTTMNTAVLSLSCTVT